MTELLNLNGKELERELAKIIRENPSIKKPWTSKEDAILKRLRETGVPHAVIAQKLGRTRKAVEDRFHQISP